MDPVRAMRTFIRIVDEGGFAAAARKLDQAPAVVTRVLAELEAHLGARLGDPIGSQHDRTAPETARSGAFLLSGTAPPGSCGSSSSWRLAGQGGHAKSGATASA